MPGGMAPLGAAGAVPGFGGSSPRCMPAGMPDEPKISHLGSSLPFFASGISCTATLCTCRLWTVRALAVVRRLLHTPHLKCLFFWWRIKSVSSCIFCD